MPPRRIAVIGCGASGLSAIKSCKEEGLEVTCFEKTDNHGGRWRYRETTSPGLASVMKSTISVNSKEMSSFSDFPPPAAFPNYLHHTKVLEYLELYATHFDLLPHVKYRQEVIRIVPAKDAEDNGRWSITSRNNITSSEATEEFDGVMICTGRLGYPAVPELPDIRGFEGKSLHTHSLKSTSEFEDKIVLVVGNGNSAVDAAVEISTLAEQVYLSTRNGSWIFPKLGQKGLPFDMMYLRRQFKALIHFSQTGVDSIVQKHLESKFNHEMYNLKPSHGVLDKHPTVNDILPDKILTGRIIIKGEVTSFEKNGAIFSGEENVTAIDAVVFGTGYHTKYPFLENKIFQNSEGEINLYKNVFPVSSKHSTLAVIGLAESQGSSIPISESQSRWVARVFNRKVKLPSLDVMLEYTRGKAEKKLNCVSAIEVDHVKYMDELAEEYGAKPNLPAMLFKDPTLYWSCYTGALLPYQYRLSGPHEWKGAREAILESQDRVLFPLRNKH